MKLADRTVEVHSAGINSSNQFTIAQTSKMFKILSDSLYSDKVMAAIRELATNAFDSHISAGNKNPFLVKLPSAADPNFSVRDYGTGLSQADMESLYTTYGASNKNDSNDFVGCLGLGSKSPFAYTKSFTTTSYFNGKQYTYIAAIDDTGVPTLNLIHSVDTDEPNGLEISFAVKQHDFHEFSRKAVRVFHYFKMKPTIIGGVGYDFNEQYGNRNIIIDGDGWRVCRLNNNNLFPSQHHRIDSGIVAIMGNIAYPVQASNMIGEEKAETPDHIARWNRAFNKADIASWKTFVSEIIDQGLYLELDFGIGELEMDVSREGLQYTKSVIKTLREKTQEIYVELKKNFSDKIAAATTRVEAITTYYTLNDLAGGWGVGATWKDSDNKDHAINSGEDLEYKLKKDENLYVFNYRTAGYRSRRMVYLTDKIHHETLTGRGQNYWNPTKKNGKITFFWCDISAVETAKKIVTRYCNENDCFGYLMVNTTDHKDVSNGFKALVKDVGEKNILNVSDHRDLIKSSPKNKGTKSSKGSVSDQEVFLLYGDTKNTSNLSYDYNDATHLKSLSSDRLDELEDEDKIVYVPILRYASVEGYPEINSIHYHKNIIDQNDLFDGENIYAIKQSSVDRLKKDGYNLVDFNTWFKDRLKSIDSSKFKSVREINSLIEYCKKEYITDDKLNRGYNEGYLDRQFLYHVLNMFGLDYEKYIANKELVSTIDSLMAIEFFADTIHRNGYDFVKFKQTDYYSHIAKLLNNIGINGLDAKKIKNTNLLYNSMTGLLNSWYGESDSKEYKKLITTKSDSGQTYTLSSISDLRKIIKSTLDSNPLLKYIMCAKTVDGNLRSLKDVNPLKQLDDRGYWGRNESHWFNTIDKVDLFKDQISKVFG